MILVSSYMESPQLTLGVFSSMVPALVSIEVLVVLYATSSIIMLWLELVSSESSSGGDLSTLYVLDPAGIDDDGDYCLLILLVSVINKVMISDILLIYVLPPR